jgi:hypothetical protein
MLLLLGTKTRRLKGYQHITKTGPNNPIPNSIGVTNRMDPPYIVASQEKILIPVGTAIIIVAAVK